MKEIIKNITPVLRAGLELVIKGVVEAAAVFLLGKIMVALTSVSVLISAGISAGVYSSWDDEQGGILSKYLPFYEFVTEWAADQGVAKAQLALGVKYRDGEGVARNYEKAAMEFRSAAKQDNVDAQYLLGKLYDEGLGVPQNDKEAAKWIKLAAEQGHVEAQNNLGVRYRDGKGVQRNNIAAYMWFDIAASSGHESADKSRKKLMKIKTMGHVERSKAKKLAEVCKAKDYRGCYDPAVKTKD